MLTADQQRVKDLLRETITLLCKNGLHFQSEFQIDGLIGITLDREDVFLVTLKETVHSGDVFIRDSKRRHLDDRNRCYEDKRRLEHRKNNVSVKSEMMKDDLAHKKLELLSAIDARQRKSAVHSRNEASCRPKNPIGREEMNSHAAQCGDDLPQHQGKGYANENAPNDLTTMDESNNSGNEGGTEPEKTKGGCFTDVGHEIGLLIDSEMEDKKGFRRSASSENQDDDNGDDSDYRRNDDEEDESFRSRRDDDEDNDDGGRGGGGGSKADFIRKTNSHKFLSPTMSSTAANNMEENDEEPLVVKVEPPDTYNPYQGGSQRSDLDFDGEGWGQHHRGHQSAPQVGGSRHYPGVNDVFNNSSSSSTAFRNATKPYIQNKGQQMSMFNDNMHQQMLNSRQQSQQQQQQQRGNNYNELFTSLVDITQNNQGFPGDEFLAGGGDFLHVASQQFPPHQQMNRLLQRRQRSTFTRTQVKCLEDVFKTVHYVDASLRMKLSRQLNLSEGTINIWFQNRRQKLKKQQQQMMMSSNPPGVPNDESLLGGGDMNPAVPGPMGGSDFIVNQSPGRPSNSSFSGSNAGSSPAYMQSPIHNNPPSSVHGAQFNPMDQCPNFSFNSEPGKT